MKCEYLILGGGIAGWTAAETLRKLLPNAEIGLVSEEHHTLYSRVLLPHYIKGKVPRERVFLRSPDHLAKRHIRSWMGRVAVSIDVQSKKIILDNSEEIVYGKLLIATGGRANSQLLTLNSQLHFFRTIEDADKIVEDLQALSAGSLCAALGSSFIALEFPPLFEKFGMKIALHLRGPGFFHRVLDHESSALIEDVVLEHGGTVFKNQTTINTSPLTKFVGIGLGMKMNMEFARRGGLTLGSGIIVSEHLETNIPHIWAAGDVAEFYDLTVGKYRHLGNWMNSEMQGRVAAANMAGEKIEFRLVSSYATRLFDLVIAFVGDVTIDQYTKVVVRGSRESRSLTRIILRYHKIVGATLLGNATDRGPITELIKNGTEISDHRLLEDKFFDLKKLA